ncbi:MAG TPA: hypothetical protein VI094_20625 [Propionibacteriaceae bacterium]
MSSHWSTTPVLTARAKRYEDCVLDNPQAKTSPMYGYSVTESGVGLYPEGNIALTGGKSGSAEQVGELIAFLASDEASHISGTEIWIDGAQPLLEG